ncbi:MULTISPECIES: hypothetical protein [Microbispora]|uniref:Uncharacterized protein n=3 Tax=Microbispora TaxID=2005 RepID=A0ABY3LSM7_9ACTN|nr:MULTISPECIES: hypothetical protein [Microbispora]KAA9375985.1 hypothetical protein F5972_25020 [Microbispora cellulosiformans]TLP57875.1 hypothetical protein FED44_20135 [Microbispora fusca]TYB52343.1 hypothetical protein FXF59_25020 [Microbispora tritici]
METNEREQQFIHLVRLAWDLRHLGIATSVMMARGEPPLLDIAWGVRRPVRIRVIRRAHGWAFIWNPWWSRFWRRDECVWALDASSAERILPAVIA